MYNNIGKVDNQTKIQGFGPPSQQLCTILGTILSSIIRPFPQLTKSDYRLLTRLSKAKLAEMDFMYEKGGGSHIVGAAVCDAKSSEVGVALERHHHLYTPPTTLSTSPTLSATVCTHALLV